MMFVNENTIFGMMNKFAILGNDGMSFFKNGKFDEIYVFGDNVDLDSLRQYKTVHLMYTTYKPTPKSKTRTNVISDISSEAFTTMKGKKYTNFRNARNRYDGKVVISRDIDVYYDAVVDCIKKWRKSLRGGLKYGKYDNSGKDYALLTRIYNNEHELRDKLDVNIFLIDDEVIGYSIIEKKHRLLDNIPIYSMLSKKCLVDDYPRINEYCEWLTFKNIYDAHKFQRFLINRGGSESNVVRYKLEKWDTYKAFKIYNTTIYNKKETTT